LISGVIANAALLVHMLRSIIHAFHSVKLCVRHYTSITRNTNGYIHHSMEPPQSRNVGT
jgi:hypothetical protein